MIDGERRNAVVSPYAYEHFMRAEMAAQLGRDAEAVDEYRLARLGPADDVLIIARLAEALERLGRHDDADAVIAEGVELDADSEALWLARARIHAGRDQLERAVDAAAHAAELAPESDEPLIVLSELLQRTEATARVDAVLSRAGDSSTALRARVVAAIAQRDGVAAGEAIEHLLRVAPARMDEVQAAARLALDGDRPVLALQLARRLPQDRGRVLHIEALLAAGRRSDAAAVVRSEPSESFGSVAEHADLLLRSGEHDRAIETAEAAIALGDVRGWVVLGQAHLNEGAFAAAAEAFSHVPIGARGDEDARRGLAEALGASGLNALADELPAAALP